MPYIYVEALDEGQEAADVVARTEVDDVESRLMGAVAERDALAEKVNALTDEAEARANAMEELTQERDSLKKSLTGANAELATAKERFASAVLAAQVPVAKPNPTDESAHSFEELWNTRSV